MKRKFLLVKILIQFIILTFIAYGIVFLPILLFFKVNIQLYLCGIAFITGSFIPEAYKEFKEVV